MARETKSKAMAAAPPIRANVRQVRSADIIPATMESRAETRKGRKCRTRKGYSPAKARNKIPCAMYLDNFILISFPFHLFKRGRGASYTGRVSGPGQGFPALIIGHRRRVLCFLYPIMRAGKRLSVLLLKRGNKHGKNHK